MHSVRVPRPPRSDRPLRTPVTLASQVRETVGVADIASCLVLFRAFFTSFAELDQQCSFKSVCRPCGFLPKNGEAHK